MHRWLSKHWYPFVVLFLLCSLSGLPSVDAELGAEEGQGELLLNCDSDDECSLSNSPSGEEVTGRQESSASPLNPKVVVLEFEMHPVQEQLALIPAECLRWS